MQLCAALLAAVVVGTWNGKWFPSGDAEHRAAPEVEARTIAEAGRLLARGLAAVDPHATNDVILCLNEIRIPKAAHDLAAAIGRTNLTVAIVSDYRWNGGHKRQKQQDAILTTLPVAARNWSVWKKEKGGRPPRGYAHADLVLAPAVTASVYAVHLKSNYPSREAKVAAANRAKRSMAIRQLLAIGKRRRGESAHPVVIAGDFNADPSRPSFKKDTLFSDLAAAGFVDPVMLLPAAVRGTYPNAKYGDSALDHICVRGLSPRSPAQVVSAGGLSDHNPVFVVVGCDIISP